MSVAFGLAAAAAAVAIGGLVIALHAIDELRGELAQLHRDLAARVTRLELERL